MTRIIGGTARGRRLDVPPHGTRPTSDRAREALFNTLATHLDLDGARVLDLFAGSGALGLEALSRGAAAAEFVESDRAACQVLRRNIAALGLPGAAVHPVPVAGYLRGAPGEPFDLVLADPPYSLDEQPLAELLAELADPRWLTASAIVVLERPSSAPPPSWPSGLTVMKTKRYGLAVLWYGRRS
jgi:16S rRNA (guanine966-N2)-methyltransferase